MNGDLRQTMFEVIGSLGSDLSYGVAIKEVAKRLGARGTEEEQLILTYWHELMRTGVLAWGLNLANPNPQWAHLTERGKKALAGWSRDPANVDGYLAAIAPVLGKGSVAWSYVTEALGTYNSGLHKATAVMIGAAGEALVLDLRNDLVERLKEQQSPIPKDLGDWRIKRVLDAVELEFTRRAKRMPSGLHERFVSYWSSFTAHLRLARNDAGHPTSIDPVTVDVVHGSLLIFPELAKLAANLREWIRSAEFA